MSFLLLSPGDFKWEMAEFPNVLIGDFSTRNWSEDSCCPSFFFFLKGLLIFSNWPFVVFDVSLSHFSVCFFFLSSPDNSETPGRKCSSWPLFPPEFQVFYLGHCYFVSFSSPARVAFSENTKKKKNSFEIDQAAAHPRPVALASACKLHDMTIENPIADEHQGRATFRWWHGRRK